MAFPGEGEVTLTWQNPDVSDFAGVVIRRSTVSPPMGVNDGNEPSGTVLSPQSYRDESVIIDTTYYYTIFSLDTNNNYLIGESISVTTSNDSDGDGLSDDYENTTVYPGGGTTDPLSSDSDGDDIDDGDEIAAGSDPMNSDNTPPVITGFSLTGDNPTDNPVVPFTLTGSDDTAITNWLVTMTDTKPLGRNSNWQTVKPIEYNLPVIKGTYTLYSWAKDEAGNVSDSLSFTVELKPTLSGIVRGPGNLPIPGAVVRLYNETDSVYTVSDDRGYYEFMDATPGRYNVTADRDGYSIFSKEVTF